MSNINKINELRKLVRETKWLDINFTKEEAIKGFKDVGVMDIEFEIRTHSFFQKKENIDKQNPNEDVYTFNQRNLYQSINKKLRETKYTLRFVQVKNTRYNSHQGLKRILPEEIKTKLEKDNHSFSMLELKGAWASYNQPYFSNMVVYVNDFTDEILYVKYDLKDVWFNDFFRSKIDNSSDNWDYLHSEKQFNLIYEQRTYKIVPMTALTNELAQEKAVKEMPELEWKEGRNNGDQSYIGLARDEITETPEGNFRVDTFQGGEINGIAKEVNHGY